MAYILQAGVPTIRQAVWEDYPAVQTLEELVFRRHQEARPDYFRSEGTGYSQAEYRALLDRPCPIAWVAEADQDVVGLCFGKIEETGGDAFCAPGRVALLEDLAVLPAYRGRGIASDLLRRARAQAREAGAVSVELCVWAFNAAALRLYTRSGFQIQYYRMEEVLGD